jgi:hypothetical protein
MHALYWVLASCIFVLAFVVDPSAFALLRDPRAQIAVALAIVLSFTVDAWAALLVALAALVLLHRLQGGSFAGGAGAGAGAGEAIITADGLRDMQTNVFNPVDYGRGMIGIRGVYGEPVYGAQGLDGERAGVLPGFAGDGNGSELP